MSQFSVPSGDLKNELCPGPKALACGFLVKTGCVLFVQSSAFNGSKPSLSHNNPKV
jgi:hypothetical protein